MLIQNEYCNGQCTCVHVHTIMQTHCRALWGKYEQVLPLHLYDTAEIEVE